MKDDYGKGGVYMSILFTYWYPFNRIGIPGMFISQQ